MTRRTGQRTNLVTSIPLLVFVACAASRNSARPIENDFSCPRMSVNQKRMKRMSRCSQSAMTSSAVVGASAMAATLSTACYGAVSGSQR